MDGIVAGRDGALTPAGARTPLLALDGFSGPLERLLELARDQRVDLARLPLAELVDQVAATVAWDDVPLPQRADWLVMGAWLLQLRSRLLLPADTLADAAARRAAEGAADRLRQRLLGLAEVQALAGWLDARPRLGRDVFARGAPEIPEALRPGEPELDVVAFLWACVDLFDADTPTPDTAERYTPATRAELHSVSDAIARIRRRLADAPDGRTLDRLLPEAAPAAAATSAHVIGSTTLSGEEVPSPNATLRRRSAWSSTFVAGLELARRGEVALAQEAPFSAVRVALATAAPAASDR